MGPGVPEAQYLPIGIGEFCWTGHVGAVCSSEMGHYGMGRRRIVATAVLI